MDNEKRYVPALRYHWLTNLFDPLVALTARERTFKQRLIQQADIREGHRVLDLGCGTGTLAIWIKQRVPGALLVGIDSDQKILELAQEKTRKTGVHVVYDHGFSTNMPYENASFDRVLSSLFFHHLSHEDKVITIQEVFRVLKPEGEFHVADWGEPQNPVMRTLFYSVQLLDGFKNTRDNVQGRLPELFVNGGSEDVKVRHEMGTVFGTMTFYSGKKPLSVTGISRARTETVR